MTRRALTTWWGVLVLAVTAGCAGTAGPPPTGRPTAARAAGGAAAPAGYSGMARVGPSEYVVVFDRKADDPGPRLALLAVGTEGRLSQRPVTVDGWPDDPPSDLESVCLLPGGAGELLAAESGYWEGRFGRIFHLALDLAGAAPRAEVLGSYPLPVVPEAAEQADYEGIACAEAEGGGVFVILGEREGALRWGTLRLGERRFEVSSQILEVAAPRPGYRPISDLHLSADGTLWAAATEDPGDAGPFRSLVYVLARLDLSAAPPVRLATPVRALWRLDGFKVEALSGPAAAVPGSRLAVGTEDEGYGGAWRPLGAPEP
ncbi:MAG TPA: hypothetical protein VHQ65_05280 [Thermoanaerobaculia bacterium]|nr:hypothetical protein [Thermoanaerobaculia bacterium]